MLYRGEVLIYEKIFTPNIIVFFCVRCVVVRDSVLYYKDGFH